MLGPRCLSGPDVVLGVLFGMPCFRVLVCAKAADVVTKTRIPSMMEWFRPGGNSKKGRTSTLPERTRRRNIYADGTSTPPERPRRGNVHAAGTSTPTRLGRRGRPS